MSDPNSEKPEIDQSLAKSHLTDRVDGPSVGTTVTNNTFHGGELSSSDPERLDDSDADAFVEGAMARLKLEVLYDGMLVQKGAPLRADTPAMIDEVVGYDELSGSDVRDLLILIKHNEAYEVKVPAIDAAFRRYIRIKQATRRHTLMAPYLRPELLAAPEKSGPEWEKVSHLFDMDSDLPICVLKHLIWQVKQKVLGRPVVHHLMPIIYSAIQGSGKTTFVRKFLSPLRELASADTLLSDFTDRRSGSIYRYLVVVIDDMEQLPVKAVPALKALITSDRINRRKVHTSSNISIRQRATLIGTANATVHQLVADETGHRRFVTLPFRNGDESKGGDGDIWEIVSTLNYQLLWSSVDAFGPSPIASVRQELHELQNRGRPTPRLLRWLRELDVDSHAVRAITVRAGVRAEGLHALYMRGGTTISRQKFAEEMSMYFSDAQAPFGEKKKVEAGAVYCLKPRWLPRPSNGAQVEVMPESVEDDGAVGLVPPSALSASSVSSGSSAPSGD